MNSSSNRQQRALPQRFVPFGVYSADGGGHLRHGPVRKLPAGAVSACIAFALAFPFPVIYQALTFYGLLFPYLGNGYTASVAMAAPFALYTYMRNYGRPMFAHSIIGRAFLFFMVMFTARASLGLAASADEEIVFFHFMTIGLFAVLFVIARYLPTEDIRVRQYVVTVFFAIALLVFLTSSDGRFLNAEILNKNALQQGVNYQGPALVMLAVFVWGALGSRGPLRFVFYAISVAALYMIGARSEFVALAILIPAVEFCRTTVRSAYVFVIPIVGVALSMGMTAVQFTGWEEGNRMVALLDLDNDLSALGRKELMENAIATIWENPLFGDYAGYGLGNYAHNVLSSWVDFGVFGFLLTCFICFGPLFALMYRSKSDSRELLFAQSLAYAIALAILMSMAKAYSYLLIPIAIGAYCKYVDGKALRVLEAKREQKRAYMEWMHSQQQAAHFATRPY